MKCLLKLPENPHIRSYGPADVAPRSAKGTAREPDVVVNGALPLFHVNQTADENSILLAKSVISISQERLAWCPIKLLSKAARISSLRLGNSHLNRRQRRGHMPEHIRWSGEQLLIVLALGNPHDRKIGDPASSQQDIQHGQ